ncbi:hypothetical protein C8A00DRAFT_47133 [Chaetomidium leptoderma]|uniref:Glutathione S-transferase UstS-like C-terminal domain-containing protein n=1 Tax=Chaetomidium leptoderma TaxID=669021 RepID=A0AAN6VD68_9PEZI|nr:hypothetical protein C8A00DRAFT_47133 [Chaetomidium leptoderma]
MNPPQPTTFYDIGSGPSSKPFAPNPWKTRYALNFSRAPHATTFVPLPEVGATRAALGLAPCRKHLDGSEFPTLPIIHDHNTTDDTLVGDSFDIALHLHTHYPAQPPLFPPHTAALHRADAGAVQKLKEFEAALGDLAAWFGRRGEGPFLEGATPMYADLIVGGWLQWMKALLPEWEDLRGWDDGLWGGLFDALEEFAEVK